MSEFQHAVDIAWVDDGRRAVVLRLDDLAAHPLVLDESAAVIWRLIPGHPTVSALIAAVADEFVVAADDVDADVRHFLDDAEVAGVVSRVRST